MRVKLDVHRPLFLAPGQGETVTNRRERTLRILAELDELIVTWFRYEPGEKGPDPHVHRLHTDAFYVLEGELEFGLGPEVQPVTGGVGTLAAAPPNVVHTFRNASDSTAIFLNVHAPSMGFGDHIRGKTDTGFDQFEPPPDGGRPLTDALVSGAGQGEWLESRSQMLVKASAEDGDGQLGLLEAVLPAGYPGPPLHLHRRTAETFFVLEGMIEFTLAGERVLLEPGGFAVAPPHLPHTFANPEETEARCVVISGPAGVERFLREAVHADPAEFAALGRRYDTFLTRD